MARGLRLSAVSAIWRSNMQRRWASGLCAVDIDDGKLALAKRLGADLVFNAKTSDPAAALKKETGGGGTRRVDHSAVADRV